MRTLLKLIVAALLCTALSISHAQSTTRPDGNWWRGQDRTYRVVYVTGFFAGMHLGHRFSFWKYSHVQEKWAQEIVVKTSESYWEYIDRYLKNVSNFQVSDGLDKFYDDYRNRSIHVWDAIWIVVNEIAGTPRAQLDAMIENWRKLERQN